MDETGVYARAHKALLDLFPLLKGETVSREQFWKLLNINPSNPTHFPFKKAVNDVLWNMTEKNIGKRIIVKNGHGFKIVDDLLVPINYKNPDAGSRFDLFLPFGIHKYGFLYRKNIMIVFGSKDSGKTAFLINTARMNMNKHRICYWSSEMVDDEFRQRLANYEGIDITGWNIEAYERSYDFDEVIEPDALNLIDFLELGGDETEYYKAVAIIRKIYDKLVNGVAIIALQKNPNSEYPKGGWGALEKSRLAVSLDSNKATLAVCKNWVEGTTTSPKGKTWTYNLVKGVNMINIQESAAE